MRHILLFILPVLQFHAQQIIIEGGASLLHSGNSQNELIIKGDTSGFFTVTSNTLRSAPKILRKFNYKVRRQIFDKEVFYIGNFNIDVLLGSFSEGKLALALAVKDDQKKKKYLVLRSYSSETGLDEAKDILLDSLEYDPGNPKQDLKILLSADQKKLYALKLEVKNGKEKLLNLTCYDTQRSLRLWKKLNTDSTYFLKGAVLLDEEGRIFALIKDPADRFTIKMFSDEKNLSSALPSPSVEIIDANIELVENKLISTGQYTCEKIQDKSKDKKTEMGFFLAEYDKATLKVTESTFDKMSVRLQNQLTYKYKNKSLNEPGKNIPFYEKTYLHFRSFYFKGDLFVVKYHGYIRAGEVVSRNEIIISKYSQSKLEWMQIIPGKNSCPEKLAFDFILGKKLNLLYFDHKDNLIYFPDVGFYYPTKYKAVTPLSAILVRVGISDNGTLESENIFTYVDWHLNFEASTKAISKPGTLIIGARDSKKLRYDVLRLVE